MDVGRIEVRPSQMPDPGQEPHMPAGHDAQALLFALLTGGDDSTDAGRTCRNGLLEEDVDARIDGGRVGTTADKADATWPIRGSSV